MSLRFKFFVRHLALSFLVLLLCFIFIYKVWYPDYLLFATGALSIILMIFAIDLITGPSLAFLIYKPHKKSLKFDLSVIIILQICALAYGMYTIAQGRPVYLVYNVDRFEVVRYNELLIDSDQEVQNAITLWSKPQITAVEFSKDNQKRQDDMFTEIFAGISIAQRPERYVPLEQVSSRIQQRSQNLNALLAFNEKADVGNALKKYPEANAWVPLKANHQDIVVLINKDQAKVIKVVNLKPWS